MFRKKKRDNLIATEDIAALEYAAEKKKKKMITLKNQKAGDLLVVFLVALLCIFGTVMIFSASYYYSLSQNGTPYAYLFRQIVWLAAGTVAMIVCSLIDYHLWVRIGYLAYLAGLVLLLAVLTSLGSDAGGATRWIVIGPITIMPGELAKPCIIAFVAKYFSRHPKWGATIKGPATIIGFTMVYALLIYKQPNLSTAITLCMIVGAMLIVAGIQWKYVIGLVGVGGIGVFALIKFADPNNYKFQRYLSFLDPFEYSQDAGYNVVQSLLALGTGGFTGRGLGNSIEKNLYLPMPQNDFIMAIIGEELGFVGILVLVSVYLLLVWRGLSIAMGAEDYSGMMLASGFTVMIGIQVIINIAVVTSSMPPTGVILPFVSYGGNALLIFMAEMGILLNISKHQRESRK